MNIYIYILHTPPTWGHPPPFWTLNRSKAALIKHVRERQRGAKKAVKKQKEAMKEQKKQ